LAILAITFSLAASSAVVDFTGSAPQCPGNVNAVEAIAISAVYYVFRSLVKEDVPATSGLLRPIKVIAPGGTIVNATLPAAVAGGNVETSQRITDVVLGALSKAAPELIPAASSGTMTGAEGTMAMALRGYLRFLGARGLCRPPMLQAEARTSRVSIVCHSA